MQTFGLCFLLFVFLCHELRFLFLLLLLLCMLDPLGDYTVPRGITSQPAKAQKTDSSSPSTSSSSVKPGGRSLEHVQSYDAYGPTHRYAQQTQSTLKQFITQLNSKPESWEKFDEVKGVVFSRRPVKGFAVPMLKGEGEVPAPPLAILQVGFFWGGFNEWFAEGDSNCRCTRCNTYT